ncbi:hypothetical protein [Candidatus Electrothrix sp.]|uniref:hypothetical protein n=1 Tax=Candidatus Electrothrix sp. TaxID=2170559 RepID=UPI0040564E5D
MRRLRSILWKQWQNPQSRVRELKKREYYSWSFSSWYTTSVLISRTALVRNPYA